MPTEPATLESILQLLAGRKDQYPGEPVTHLEHALQCAQLARSVDADDENVAAALLHDVGLLLDPGRDHAGSDHAAVGAAYLLRWGFSRKIAELVGGHVDAKRYLAAVKPRYYDQLSTASRQSLAEEGGPMSPEEIQLFENDALYGEKLRMRVWDEMAKVPGAEVAGLDSYRDLLVRLLRPPL